MKNRFYIFLLLIVVCCCNINKVKAQAVVTDPKSMYQRMMQHLKDANQWTNENIANAKLFVEARKRLQQLDSTKQVLQGHYNYAKKIQAELEKIRAIKNMKISDGVYLTERLLGEKLNPAEYIPRTEFTKKLRENVNNNSSSNVAYDAKVLYRDFFNYEELKKYDKEELAKLEASLNEAQMQLKIQELLAVIETCNRTIDMAQEQYDILNMDKKLKMTDGERLAAMNKCNRILLDAIELRNDAQNKLIALKVQGTQNTAVIVQEERKEKFYKEVAKELINVNHPNKLRLRNHFSLYKYGKSKGRI